MGRVPAVRRGALAALLSALLLGAGAEQAAALDVFVTGAAFVVAEDQDPFEPNDVWHEENDVAAVQVGDNIALQDANNGITYDPSRCVASPGGFQPVVCNVSGLTSALIIVDELGDVATTDLGLRTVLCGGPGDDGLTTGSGEDFIIGGPGNDSMLGGPGNDLLRGESGGLDGDPESDDECEVAPGIAAGVNGLNGELGDDRLFGGGADDALLGDAGDDTLFGLGGGDLVRGDEGNDFIAGFEGEDELKGGGGADVLGGGDGRDSLEGGEGNDELGVSFRIDIDETPLTTSEEGNDTLDGGGGDDVLNGGPGAAAFHYGVLPEPLAPTSAANGADVLNGGGGADHVTYANRSAGVTVSSDGLADDGLVGEHDNVAPDVEKVTGGNAGDMLTGGAGADSLDGAAGPDTIVGGAGADALTGGANDEAADVLRGGTDADSLQGGPGPDGLSGDDGTDEVNGGGGPDSVDGGAGDDVQLGGTGDDVLFDGPGADTLDGQDGRGDTVDYSAISAPVTVILDIVRNDGVAGQDLIQAVEDVLGGPGDDTLTGDVAANLLSGAGGADLITGGGGPDVLRGETGGDLLRARDGERDNIDCGAARDLVFVDGEDELLPLPRGGCEHVESGRRRMARRGETLLSPRGCSVPVLLPGWSRAFSIGERISLPPRSRLDTRLCAVALSVGQLSRRARICDALER